MAGYISRFLIATLAVTTLATMAQAGFISGTFDLNGTMTVTAAPTTPRVISWTRTAGGTANLADIANQSGFFASMVGPVGIANLVDPPEVVDGGGFPLTPFLSNALMGVSNALDINFIYAGIYSSAQCGSAPAVGQVCTIANSPFSFVNQPGGGSTASFVLAGTTHDGLSRWTGTFTVQFDTPFQTVFTNNLTNPITNTYSGTIVATAIPEPGTLATMGLSGLGLLAFARWRRRK